MKKIIFNQEQINDIIKDYTVNHLTLKEIGLKNNVSRTVITRIIKENNIQINTHHYYYADYNKFENIDSAEKAYWLGFIAADGCNYSRKENASLIINIHQKDKKHLENFKVFMNSNVEIKDFIQSWGYSNETPMSKIIFNSKKLSEDLSKIGIVPKKSLILQPPKIKEEFYLPFILGYFDGDGSIYKTKQYNNFALSIEGTEEILKWIMQILQVNLKLEKRYKDDKNNYCIRCGGTNKPYEILKKLYESTEIHLDRKYKIFKELETVVFSRNIKDY